MSTRGFPGGAWLVAGLAVVVVACGPRKPAEDASSTSEESSKNDGTKDTKWEDATPEDKARAADPVKADAKEAAATPPPSRRNDTYDKEATEMVLKRAARQVKANCGMATDSDGKAAGPWGKVNVSINLGHNGHSKGATIPAPYDGKPSGRCAVQAFGNLTYPPWAGADATVDWEVELVQPPPAAPPPK